MCKSADCDCKSGPDAILLFGLMSYRVHWPSAIGDCRYVAIADSDESCGPDRDIKHGSMLIASITIAYVMKPCHTEAPIAMNVADAMRHYNMV